MTEIPVSVPDGVAGAYRVESFTVTEDDARWTALRSALGRDEYVPPGNYKRLMRGNTVVMSNTPMEIRTNMEFIRAASGDVLINGLGIGMVLSAILDKPEVRSVTIVERAAEVIELVGPAFRKDHRVRIVEADALDFRPPKGAQYDTVWHDIWDYISTDNLSEMHRLHRKYGRRAAWQRSWCRLQCEWHKARTPRWGR